MKDFNMVERGEEINKVPQSAGHYILTHTDLGGTENDKAVRLGPCDTSLISRQEYHMSRRQLLANAARL